MTVTAAPHTFWCEADQDWAHLPSHLVDGDTDAISVESDGPCPLGCGAVLTDVVVRPGVVA